MEKWTCNMCDAWTEQQLHVGIGGGRGGGKGEGGGCSRTACLLAALGVMAGVRAEWSWAAETFFCDWSTIIGSTIFSASCQHFLCHCFLMSALGVEVYPAWEAAGSAIWDPVRNCRRQRPCTPFSVAFKISVFINSTLSFSVIKVFLPMFYSKTAPACKRRGLRRQIATAGRVFQPC